jgi:hypothetical protein
MTGGAHHAASRGSPARGADLATKRDLRELGQRLIIQLSVVMVAVAGLAGTLVHCWR